MMVFDILPVVPNMFMTGQIIYLKCYRHWTLSSISIAAGSFLHDKEGDRVTNKNTFLV